MIIEVSDSELLDKLSILEVKKQKLTDPEKLKYVQHEFEHLSLKANTLDYSLDDESYVRLREINFLLWDIEDEIRAKGDAEEYDDRFIQLSKSIYELNDERFRVKNAINKKTQSFFQEQKGHKNT